MDETNDAGGEADKKPTSDRIWLQLVAIARRWLDVAAMALAGAAVVIGFAAVFSLPELSLPVARDAPGAILIVLSVGVVVFVLRTLYHIPPPKPTRDDDNTELNITPSKSSKRFAIIKQYLSPRNLRMLLVSLGFWGQSAWRYPSAVVAGIGGALLLLVFAYHYDGTLLWYTRHEAILLQRYLASILTFATYNLLWVMPSICVYAAMLIVERRCGLAQLSASDVEPDLSIWDKPSIQASDITQEWFENWIKDDKEIERPEDDAFGQHRRIAKTIGERMIQTAKGHGSGTTQLVGGLGSGKSTIGKLTRCYLDRRGVLEQPGGVLFAQVSLFGYDNAQAAVRGVLTAAIAEIGKVAPTLALSGVPAQYLHAAAAQTPGMGWLAGLLSIGMNNDDLQSILKKMDDVLAAVGCELVLWVEDLERFAGNDVIGDDQSELMQQNEVERLAPVRAMLYHLDRAAHISVVVADTSLRSRFDVEKIARWTCRLILPEPKSARMIIRRSCDGLECTRINAMYDLKVGDYLEAAWFARLRLMGETGRLVSLYSVFESYEAGPRALKQIARDWRATSLQCGRDINLLDLLILTAIKVLDPRVYALLGTGHCRERLRNIARRVVLSDPNSDVSQLEAQDRFLKGRAADIRVIVQQCQQRSWLVRSDLDPGDTVGLMMKVLMCDFNEVPGRARWYRGCAQSMFGWPMTFNRFLVYLEGSAREGDKTDSAFWERLQEWSRTDGEEREAARLVWDDHPVPDSQQLMLYAHRIWPSELRSRDYRPRPVSWPWPPVVNEICRIAKVPADSIF